MLKNLKSVLKKMLKTQGEEEVSPVLPPDISGKAPEDLSYDEIALAVGRVDVWEKHKDFQIKFLQNHGMMPEHSMLDIGAGVLRGGLVAIEYLDQGNYYGLDIDKKLLDVGRFRLKEAGLEGKEPVLVSEQEFKDYNFDRKFDFIQAFHVFIHLDDSILEKCFDFISQNLSETGVCYGTVNMKEIKPARWKNKFPVMSHKLEFYQSLGEKYGLAIEQLNMNEWERENLPDHECLVIKLKA